MDVAPPPEEIADLAQRCVLHVESRFGLRPDFTPETLSLVDHLIEEVLAEEARGAAPPPGHRLRSQLASILVPILGAYFGEVVRRGFPCRWRSAGGGPAGWLLEFEHCPLRFHPFAAVAEAILRSTISDGPAVLRPAPQLVDGLRQRLAAAPPLPDDQFHTLTTRFEVLQISIEWLDADGTAAGLTVEDYDRIFGSR